MKSAGSGVIVWEVSQDIHGPAAKMDWELDRTKLGSDGSGFAPELKTCRDYRVAIAPRALFDPMESDRRSSFLFGRIFCDEPVATSSGTLGFRGNFAGSGPYNLMCFRNRIADPHDWGTKHPDPKTTSYFAGFMSDELMRRLAPASSISRRHQPGV